MSRRIEDRTLALAGMLQTCRLVQQIAHHGTADAHSLEQALAPLFVTEPEDTAAVYGGVDKVHEGLHLLVGQLGDKSTTDPELLRYVIGLLHLERKLSRRKDLLNTISEGLDQAKRQMEHFPLSHENIIAKLAETYLNTLSTLQPRIIVQGEGGHLEQQANADKVRALLLAAMRSAVLWRQCGGGRLQLLFRRGAFLAAAKRLIGVVH